MCASAHCGSPSASDVLGTLLLTLVPWLFFVMVSCLFAFAYHRERLLDWGLVAALAGVSVMLIAPDARRKTSGGSWYLFLGLLSFFAVVASGLCGLYNYQENMFQDGSYEENRLYTNVMPSELAAAHPDARKSSSAPMRGLTLRARSATRQARFSAWPPSRTIPCPPGSKSG